MMNNRKYEEFPETNTVRFSNGADSITISAKFINGVPHMTIDETERVAKWCIAHGNKKGYELLEQIACVRMKNNIKREGK